MKSRIKAISLLSGGLDSMLAVKVLQKAGVEVAGLVFTTPFFGAEKAQKAAKELGVRLIIKDIAGEHLKMLKSPKYGYGKNFNPCIDCHGLMLKIAKSVMKKEKAQFVATGEVLGQRPMSQNEQALKIVEKLAGLENQIVRPLSARLLPKTLAEEKGFVKRESLLDIQGRGRARQMELAKIFKIKDYPSPSGGCLLTDPEFAKRLKDLFRHKKNFNKNDAELLKCGRHFWVKGDWVIVGRDEADNHRIFELAKNSDFLVELEDFPGPLVFLRGKNIEEAKKLAQHYSTKARNLASVRFCLAKKKVFVYN